MKSRNIIQSNVPPGKLSVSDFSFGEIEVGEPGEGEALVRAIYISVDPYLMMRFRKGDFEDNRVRSRLIGRVEKSRAPGVAEGDLVLGFGEWQERLIMPASELRIIRPKVPLPAYLGAIGHSGYTAMLGMELLDVQPGQTFTVSSAAGMVGTVAGQLARLAGARVVGIAGGDKAQAVVDNFGFDAGVDYRAGDLGASLAKAAPDGIDRHFENVGTSMLNPVMDNANKFARIALCGMIEHYADDDPICFANFKQMMVKSLTMSGFSIYDHLDRYEAGLAKLEELYLSGDLKSIEVVHEGFENIPAAEVAMLGGEGIGKHMVKVGPE